MRQLRLLILLLIWLLYHLVTLTYSPLPWLDETMFSSISHSVATEGTMYCKVAPLALRGEEILVYGPVYFYVTAFFEHLFGFGMMQFRLAGVLSCLAVILFSLLIFTRNISRWRNPAIYLFVLLLFDPGLSSSMHGGRMDLMACAFVLASAYLLLRSANNKNNTGLLLIACSGLCAALALLTTPRVAVLLVAPALVLIIRWLQGFSWLRFLEGSCWLLVMLLPLTAWVAFAFGNFSEFISQFSAVNAYGASFGGNIFHWRYIGSYALTMYPLLIVMLVTVAIGISRKGKAYFTEVRIICLVSVLMFFLLIFEVGGYYVLIVPFMYILIIDGFTWEQYEIPAWLRRGMLFGILCFSIAVFTVKTLHISQSIEQRDPVDLRRFLATAIPAGSKVIGDEPFYYAVMENGSSYALMNWISTTEPREKHLREVYDYDFLIISDNLHKREPDLLEYFAQRATLVPLGSYETQSGPAVRIPFASKVFDSYGCTVYKRMKDPRSTCF